MKGALVILLAAVIAACSSAPAERSTVLTSNVQRAPADPSSAVTAALAINDFGLDLYRLLAAGDPQNTVISPASIAIALSMARLGARGQTATEMDAVLHGLMADGPESMNALDRALAARSRSVTDGMGEQQEIVLRIANAPFAQRDFGWQQEFIDGLAASFGAGLRLVDYRADPDGARQTINDWVSEQTEQRIPELLSPGTIDTSARLTLVNAIYLKAAWAMPFEDDATAPRAFTRPDGSTVEAPFMNNQSSWRYGAGDGWQAIELPYAGEELAMMLILPEDLGDFTGQLDGAALADIGRALDWQQVELSMPRFETETSAALNDMLIELGMPSAFGAADFSGMTEEEQLFISAVVHQANITVDEKGTEAAAATAVIMAGSAAPEDPIPLVLDRPFLFALRDMETGAVLFLGQIVDPSAD